MSVAADWVTAGAAWRASLTPIGAEPSDPARPPRVFNVSGLTPASAARAYNRVHSVRALDHIAGEIPNAKPVAKVGDPADDMYGKGFHPELPNYDSDIPVNHLPPPPNPATSTPATTPAPSATSPTQTGPAPAAGPSPVNTGTPATQAKTLPTIPGLPGFDPEAAAVLSDASTAGGLPAPLAAVQMSQLQPGESTQFGGATITATPEGGYSANSVDPTTGAVNTTVWNMHSSVVLTSQSTPVPGTDGNSWETTITHADGKVSEVFSVAGPDGITTFTANPDGSHSVQYPDGTIVNEPPPGSSLPVIVTQLGPDGRSGHTGAYYPDGRVVESGFRPSDVFGTPVTDVFGPDGGHVNVLTVPGRDSGAPFSIVTDDGGNRTVVGPDNSATSIDRYNNAIGGSNSATHFDPFAGSWTEDKISHRGPTSYAPDGTATQPWYYVGPGGELRTAIAYFDKNNQLTMLTDSDYKGMKWSSFETIDGVSVPMQSGALDAGNVEDNAILVFELATLIVDLPFAAAGWGARIGTHWYGSRLAGPGSSLAARELAGSQLSTRALTGVTTAASVTVLDRLRAAIVARNPKPDHVAPRTHAILPVQASPTPAQTTAIPGVPSAPIPVRTAVGVPGAGAPRASALSSEGSATANGVQSVSGNSDGLARSVPLGIDVRKYIQTNSSIDRTLVKVNPKFNRHEAAYSENCTSCVMVYELRRRGLPGVGRTASPLETYLRSDHSGAGGGRPLTVLTDVWKRPFRKGNRAEVEAAFSDVGSRGIVFVKWRSGTAGHVFSVENVGGVVRFVDAQPTPVKYDASEYFDRAKDGMVLYLRVDHLPTPSEWRVRRFLE